MEKFERNDEPSGARGAHGPRWMSTNGPRTEVECFELDHRDGDKGVRVSVVQYNSNRPDVGVACMDLDSAEAFATEILRIVRRLRDKQAGTKRSTPSVLQPWLEEIPIRMQSTLLLGLRGPDTHACPNVKAIGRWLRGLAFKPGNPANVREFMGAMPDRIVEKGPAAKELEFCSQHYYSHLAHALEVVGYCHPDHAVAEHAHALFADMCALMHMPVESPSSFAKRLGRLSWPGGGQPNDFAEACALLETGVTE